MGMPKTIVAFFIVAFVQTQPAGAETPAARPQALRPQRQVEQTHQAMVSHEPIYQLTEDVAALLQQLHAIVSDVHAPVEPSIEFLLGKLHIDLSEIERVHGTSLVEARRWLEGFEQEGTRLRETIRSGASEVSLNIYYVHVFLAEITKAVLKTRGQILYSSFTGQDWRVVLGKVLRRVQLEYRDDKTELLFVRPLWRDGSRIEFILAGFWSPLTGIVLVPEGLTLFLRHKPLEDFTEADRSVVLLEFQAALLEEVRHWMDEAIGQSAVSDREFWMNPELTVQALQALLRDDANLNEFFRTALLRDRYAGTFVVREFSGLLAAMALHPDPFVIYQVRRRTYEPLPQEDPHRVAWLEFHQLFQNHFADLRSITSSQQFRLILKAMAQHEFRHPLDEPPLPSITPEGELSWERSPLKLELADIEAFLSPMQPVKAEGLETDQPQRTLPDALTIHEAISLSL